MPETPGALMRRFKREVANPDDRVEGEQVTKFFWLPAETMALAHSAPTGTGRGPVYYAMPTWSVTNLLSWWTLAEIEAARDIHDGYNGTVNGNPVYTQGVDLDIDRVRRFLRFDGTGDNVDVGYITHLDGAATVSFAARFRIDSSANPTFEHYLIGKYPATAGNRQFLIGISPLGGVFRVIVYIHDGTGLIWGVGPADLSLNVFYTIVVSYNGGLATNAERLKIYLNGSPVSLSFSGTIPATFRATGGDNVFIGDVINGSGGNEWHGDIYDVAIWETTLSEAQALAYHDDILTDRIVAGFFKAS